MSARSTSTQSADPSCSPRARSASRCVATAPPARRTASRRSVGPEVALRQCRRRDLQRRQLRIQALDAGTGRGRRGTGTRPGSCGRSGTGPPPRWRRSCSPRRAGARRSGARSARPRRDRTPTPTPARPTRSRAPRARSCGRAGARRRPAPPRGCSRARAHPGAPRRSARRPPGRSAGARRRSSRDRSARRGPRPSGVTVISTLMTRRGTPGRRLHRSLDRRAGSIGSTVPGTYSEHPRRAASRSTAVPGCT